MCLILNRGFVAVSGPDLVVVKVMSGSDLDATGTEFCIDMFVDDDRDMATG